MPITVNIKNGVVILSGTRNDQEGKNAEYNGTITETFCLQDIRGAHKGTWSNYDNLYSLDVKLHGTVDYWIEVPINEGEGEQVTKAFGEIWQAGRCREEGTWKSDSDPTKIYEPAQY